MAGNSIENRPSDAGLRPPTESAADNGHTPHDFRLGRWERRNALGWVSQNGAMDGFWKNARWAPLRTILKLPMVVRAATPTVQASLGGFLLGSIATGAGLAKRGIMKCAGKKLPERIDVPLTSAIDPSREIRQGNLEDVQKNMRYAAAMQFMNAPHNGLSRRMLLSSDGAAANRRENANCVASAHAANQLGAEDQWDYLVVRKKDFPPADDRKAQAFWNNLPDEIKSNINKHGVYGDPRTGNAIAILYDKKSGEIVISHAATGNNPSADDDYSGAQIRSNYANWLGTTDAPPSVKQAVVFGKLVREAAGKAGMVDGNGEVKVVDVGYSRGGLMAQAAALASHGRAVCSNAEPMGAATQRYVGLGVNRKKDASTRITHLSHEHDKLSTQVGLRRVGQGFRALTGLPTQASAGEFIALPGRFDPKNTAWHQSWGGKGHVDPFFQLVEASNQLGYKRRLSSDSITLQLGLALLEDLPSESLEKLSSQVGADTFPEELREAAEVMHWHMELGTLQPYDKASENDSFKAFLKMAAGQILDEDERIAADKYIWNMDHLRDSMKLAQRCVEAETGKKHENLINHYARKPNLGLYDLRRARERDRAEVPAQKVTDHDVLVHAMAGVPLPQQVKQAPRNDDMAPQHGDLSSAPEPDQEPAHLGVSHADDPAEQASKSSIRIDWDAPVQIEPIPADRQPRPDPAGMSNEQVNNLKEASHRIARLHARIVDTSSGAPQPFFDNADVLALRRQLEFKDPFDVNEVKRLRWSLEKQLLNGRFFEETLSNQDFLRALGEIRVPNEDLMPTSSGVPDNESSR